MHGIHRVKGYKGAYLLRKNVEDGVEFATLTLWESMDAVRVFAGEDNEVAVVPSEVRKLLYKFYKISKQYKTVIEPD